MGPASHAIEEEYIPYGPQVPSSNAVLVVLGCVLFSGAVLVLPWWLNALTVFPYLFVGLTLLIGALLYRAFPVLYVGYTFGLWFIAPLVARFIDYEIGVYQDFNIITYAPHLVSGLTIFSLWRHRSRVLSKDRFPFVLVLTGLLYGYAVGIVMSGPVPATYGLLKWGVPVLFGLHLTFHWHDFPALSRCLQNVYFWSIVLMGSYALIQFYLLPPWDAFWMTNVEWRDGSLGLPRPLMVRPYSSLDSWSAFSKVMMAGLLVLFSMPTRKHLIAAIPGYAGFLVVLSRAAWAGWLLGLMIMAVWIRGRMRMRLIGTFAVGMLVVLPLLTVPEISSRVTDRLGTLQNLETDGSLQTRMGQYERNTLRVLTNPVGDGLSFQIYRWDSGFLVMVHQLGWPGLLLFMMGLFLLLRLLWRSRSQTNDAFIAICTTVTLVIVAMLPLDNSFPDVTGMVFWCLAALTLASYRYLRAEDLEAMDLEEEASAETEGEVLS